MRYLAAIALIGIYLLLCWICWRKYQRQSGSASNGRASELLIAYASQTGSASRIARQTAEQLHAAGEQAQVITLNQLDAARLLQIKKLLIVASTYGEGEAPDNGNRFITHCLGQLGDKNLQHLQVAILGLGDSSYRYFCGFAHQLHHQLHHRGAQLLADVIEVDRQDQSALRHWQYYVGQVSGHFRYRDWSKPEYEQWQIIQRYCVNPGSQGAPAYHVQLRPMTGDISLDHWRAGDIAEIGPGNSDQAITHFLQQLPGVNVEKELLRYRDLQQVQALREIMSTLDAQTLAENLPELPQREYSIATVPHEGSLDLLVRERVLGAGELGLGSGWLIHHAPLHQPIRLRVRSNYHFHAPDNHRPLILIGNGTGIAGLRAHLANPEREGAWHWLFFGERSAAKDNFFHADIQRWQSEGRLTRVNCIFSRDALPGSPRYVQDLLLANASELQRWVGEGAAIYVCGSLQGMAQAVDEILGQILGLELLEQMADTRRYCRDVY